MKPRVLAVTLILAVIFVAKPLWAHHGEANYDASKVVSVKGTVTEFQFINPHVIISLDVKNDKGVIEKWVGEARSPGMLVRIGGWNKNTITPGDVIIASGHRAKGGSNVLRLEKVVLPNGREMSDL